MNKQELQEAMTEADLAYVNRTGVQPYLGMGAKLGLGQSGDWRCSIWVKPSGEKQDIYGNGDTPESAIAAIMDAIAALPDIKEQSALRYREALANALEVGRAEAIDDEFVIPVRSAMETFTEKALPHHKVAAE